MKVELPERKQEQAARAARSQSCGRAAQGQALTEHKVETEKAYRMTSSQSGMASYYGSSRGSQTASGARFNPNAMTAAHRSLPFGTKVRVTNKSNGRSVVVTINDRGPFIRGRIIDLSTAAAGVIGMKGAGVARGHRRTSRRLRLRPLRQQKAAGASAPAAFFFGAITCASADDEALQGREIGDEAGNAQLAHADQQHAADHDGGAAQGDEHGGARAGQMAGVVEV